MFVWPSGWMPAIVALEVADPAQRLGLDDPVGRLVERDDAELVARRHRRGRPQDRLLADVDLADARICRAPPMPPSNELQWQASIEPDLSMTTTRAMSGCFSRSRTPMSTGSVFLDRRVLVAARAVAPRPADHDEALAEVADVDLEGGHLALGQRRPRHVDEHDRVVRRRAESGSPGRPGRRHRVDRPGARPRAQSTSSAATASSPDTTRIRGSPWTIVFESARSFWLNVFRAASTTARNRTKPASCGLDEERRPCSSRPRGRAARCRPGRRSRTAGPWPAGRPSS